MTITDNPSANIRVYACVRVQPRFGAGARSRKLEFFITDDTSVCGMKLFSPEHSDCGKYAQMINEALLEKYPSMNYSIHSIIIVRDTNNTMIGFDLCYIVDSVLYMTNFSIDDRYEKLVERVCHKYYNRHLYPEEVSFIDWV